MADGVAMQHARPYERVYHLAVYLLSQALSQATAIIRGLVVPNLLGPASYGLIATVNAVDRYTPYVSGGSHWYVVNRVPVIDDGEERARILDAIFAFTVVTSILSAMVFVGAALFQRPSRGLLVAYGVATLALNPFASGLWRLHTSLLRVDGHVPRMMRLSNAQTLLSSVLIIGLTFWLGAIGTFTAQLLTSVASLMLLATSPYRFRFRWSTAALRVVLKFSIPVFFVSGLLLTTFDSMEIFVLAHRLGVSAVGMYAWGASMAALLLMWTNGITTIYSTPVVRAIHADVTTGARDGVRLFARLILANSILFVGLGVMAYVFLPIAARLVFPRFVPAIDVAQLLIVSVYWENIRSLGLFVLTAQDRFTSYLIALGGIVALFLPVLWWAAPSGMVILALVVIARRLSVAQVVMHIGMRRSFRSGARYWTFCVAIHALGFVPLVVGQWIDFRGLEVTRQNFFEVAPQVTGAFGLLAATYLAILYGLHRRFRILAPLWHT